MSTVHSLIREEIGQMFPEWCQNIVTSLTGRCRDLEVSNNSNKIYQNYSKNTQFVLDLIILLSAIFLNISLIKFSPLILQLVCYPWLVLLTTGRLRKFQVTHGHHLSHISIGNRSWLDSFLLELSCLIPWSQNYLEYKRDHNIHHTKASFTGADDPDAALLLKLNFRPGMSKEKLWRHLFWTFLDPSFHWILIRGRFVSNLTNLSLAKIFYLGIHGALIYQLGWSIYSLTILVPWFPIYHISALLQFLSEHQWLITPKPPKLDEEYKKRCWGRFLGEAPPENKSMGNLSKWYVKFFLYHLPIRTAVLVSDLPCHDWHHLVKNSPDQWVDASQLRTEYIIKGEMPDQSFWGIDSVIDHVFDGLSNSTYSFSSDLPDQSDN